MNNSLLNRYKNNNNDLNLETVDHCHIDKRHFLYPVREISKSHHILNQDKLKEISLKSRILLILFKTITNNN